MRVVFRADSAADIGTGHVARCLALAIALRERGAVCSFIARRITRPQAEAIRVEGIEVRHPETDSRGDWTPEADAAMTLRCIGNATVDWVVVDHYLLESRWESVLRKVATRIAAIDDIANRSHNCDLLIDQNLHAAAANRYVGRISGSAETLLGPRYALLRQEFLLARPAARPREGAVRRILVAFGGIDLADHTSLALQAIELLGLRGTHIDVVIGADHRSRSRLADTCARLGFTLHVQTKDMAALMSSADLAVGAGGIAVWERCALGLPALVLTAADNQNDQLREVAACGAVYAPSFSPVTAEALAKHVGELVENPQLRAAMSRQAMQLVDGRGTHRVARAMGIFATRVRPAIREDAADLFEWRNHPSVRRVSRSTEEIPWERHVAWLDSVLSGSDRVLLVGESLDRPVGVVRFDVNGDSADVSIYMVPKEIEKRLGVDLLLSAEQWLMNDRPAVRTLRAEILGGNVASRRLFSSAGYSAGTVHYTKRIP